MQSRYIKFGIPIVVILGTLLYLAATGIGQSKSYYKTIKELQAMGDEAYSTRLRVAGNVVPGTIQRHGSNADFVLEEQGLQIKVSYRGMEPPPDTFKDNAQALAEGTYGRDGVFHAKQIQAKCASKYSPAKDGQTPGNKTPENAPATSAPVKPAMS